MELVRASGVTLIVTNKGLSMELFWRPSHMDTHARARPRSMRGISLSDVYGGGAKLRVEPGHSIKQVAKSG
jgi:hypothetical protein